jgi:rRNA processing protein Gar1
VPLILASRAPLASIDFEGHTRDISGGGVYFTVHEQLMPGKNNGAGEMAFSLSQALESGSILEIKIVLPNSEKPVRCMAKILRVTQSRELVGKVEEVFCRVGASFLAIESEDRCRLIRFCETSKESHEAV